MINVLGLDVGGANLKMAHTDGTARTMPFELWKQPHQLPAVLPELVASAPRFDGVAVTMTGELCDCFETKREGVHTILDAVETACPRQPLWIWRHDGQFVDLATARQTPYQVAAANWLALATYAGRFAAMGSALLIDIGSTTTDIIPLVNGDPVPQGRTDSERLLSGELVYRGVRRTPLFFALRQRIVAEVFATMVDAFLLTNQQPENAGDQATADGRPATKKYAHDRLARMLGGDGATCSETATLQLAQVAIQNVFQEIAEAVGRVAGRLPAMPVTVLSAGSGEFFARSIVEHFNAMPPPVLISLGGRLGRDLSAAACAYAVAVLASEKCALS